MPDDRVEQAITRHDLDEVTRQFRACQTYREECRHEVNALSQRLARIEGMWALVWTVIAAVITQSTMLLIGGGR